MAGTISPYEYGRRLHEAQRYYEQHKHSPSNNNNLAHQYKYELGKAATANPDHFKRDGSTGSKNIDAHDHETGCRLIRDGKCNQETYAKVLEDHSPNAGIHARPQNRQFYSQSMAHSCDRTVNVPKTHEGRTKVNQHPGRSQSSIEERSQQQLTATHRAQQQERER